MRSAWRLLLGLGLAHAAPALAQEPPSVQPGGVATMVVTAEPSGDTLRFSLAPAEGVRVFSAATGQVAAAPGRAIRLPFTFGLPAHSAAGPLVVSRLTLEWSDGQRETRDLVVNVETRRGALVRLTDDVVTAAPGSTAEVGYRIRNDGNAADTFQLRLSAPPAWAIPAPLTILVLPAGDEAVGTFHVRVPATVTRGEEHIVRMVAEGSGVREVRSARVTVVGEESRLGNLASVPGSVFVGSAFEEGGTTSGVALTARGEVRPGTRVTLDLRHVEATTTAPALRAELSGPRMRLALDGSGWSARGGDLVSLPDLVQGPAIQGRGVEGTLDLGALRSEVFVARPWSYVGDPDVGHILRTATRYRTDVGTFGIRAASVRRDGMLLPGYEQAGAALTYSFRGAGHTMEAEVGAVRVADDAASVTGMATQLRYSLDRGPVALSARVRTVPGTTLRTSSHGNEAFVAGDLALSPAVTLTASGYATDAPRVDESPHPESRGATAGFRFRLPAGVNARVLATHRSTDMVGSTAHGTATRTIVVGADVPVAGIVLETGAHVGVTRVGPEDRPYRNARLGGRWSQANQWAWLGLSHYDFGVGGPQTRAELSGSVRIRSTELQGGLSTRIDGAEELRRASIWSALAVPVQDRTSLNLGMEYRGYMQGSPWRLSLGVGRTFGMPVPIARVPVVQGVIFEDLDGDGLRGPGEPGLPDVAVTLGSLRTRTDASGRFRFYDTGGGPLRVDPTSLPGGMTLVPATELPTRGTATIPVARTASLELRIFLDRDGDGVMGDGDVFAAGAVVTIRDAAGSSRDAAVDGAGRARFGSLAPGRYAIAIERPNGRAAAAPFETEIVLGPGAREQMMIGLPFRDLPIRLPNGARLEPGAMPGDPVEGTTPRAPVEPAAAEAALDESAPADGSMGDPAVDPTPSLGRAAEAAEAPVVEPADTPAWSLAGSHGAPRLAAEPVMPASDGLGRGPVPHPVSLLLLAFLAAVALRRRLTQPWPARALPED